MRHCRLFAGLILAAYASVASAQTNEVHFMLGNASDQSAIVANCTFSDHGTIMRCRGIQLSVTYEVDPKDLQRALKGASSEVDEKFKTDADVKKYCTDLQTQPNASQLLAGNVAAEQQEHLNVTGRLVVEDLKAVQAMCEHPSTAALRELFRHEVIAETRQCKIQASLPQEDELKKVSATKWISVTGPAGLCHAVTTTTLERKHKDSPLWTWTDVHSAADRSSELCRAVPLNKPVVWSWQGGRFPMTCESMIFD
jgi:hypothetical protein